MTRVFQHVLRKSCANLMKALPATQSISGNFYGFFWKELSDGDRIRFELEVQNSVSVTQFLPKDPTTRQRGVAWFNRER
jgi:hypothetical protein